MKHVRENTILLFEMYTLLESNDSSSAGYARQCGMLRGRLQRKSSAHIRDVCTLP